MAKVLEVRTSLTDTEIEKRVFEVARYDRFSVFTFELRSEEHQLEVANTDGVNVTSGDGSTFLGYVEDWDDSHYYVNLK